MNYHFNWIRLPDAVWHNMSSVCKNTATPLMSSMKWDHSLALSFTDVTTCHKLTALPQWSVFQMPRQGRQVNIIMHRSYRSLIYTVTQIVWQVGQELGIYHVFFMSVKIYDDFLMEWNIMKGSWKRCLSKHYWKQPSLFVCIHLLTFSWEILNYSSIIGPSLKFHVFIAILGFIMH